MKGKKLAMTWAYSPSYGKPLSVPQGVIGLMTRMGMEVVLAHPEGYEVMPEVLEVAKNNAEKSGDLSVYPMIWLMHLRMLTSFILRAGHLFAAMEKRTDLYGNGDMDGIKALEKELLAQNANHKDGAVLKN